MYLDLRSSLLYMGGSWILAVCLHLMGFYALICNYLVTLFGVINCVFDFLGEVCKMACPSRGFNVSYSWIFIIVVSAVTVVIRF